MRLLFLAYLNRSGSTLLANLLSRDPGFCVCPEAHRPLRRILARPGKPLEPRSRDRFLADLRSEAKLAGWGLSGLGKDRFPPGASGWEVFRSLVEAYRERTVPGARVVVVKGAFFLDLLQGDEGLPAPEFRIAALLRDPRAVFASQRRSVSTNTGLPMALSPGAFGTRWRRFVERVEGAAADPRVAVFRYEELVRDPEEVMEGAGRLLELEEPAGAEGDGAFPAALEERIPPAQRHLHPRVGEAPDPGRIAAWREELAPLEVDLLQRGAGPAMLRWGYEPSEVRVSPLVRAPARAVYGFREALLRLRRLVKD